SFEEFPHCLLYNSLVTLADGKPFLPICYELVFVPSPDVVHFVYNRMTREEVCDHAIPAKLHRGRSVSEDPFVCRLGRGKPGIGRCDDDVLRGACAYGIDSRDQCGCSCTS